MGSPGDLNSTIVALHSNQFLQASHPNNRSRFCHDFLSVNICLHNLDWALNTALIYYMSCKKGDAQESWPSQISFYPQQSKEFALGATLCLSLCQRSCNTNASGGIPSPMVRTDSICLVNLLNHIWLQEMRCKMRHFLLKVAVCLVLQDKLDSERFLHIIGMF